MPSSLVSLSLGSNLGERARSISLAALRLALMPGVDLLRVSSLYETAPWGVQDQPPFLNAALLARVTLSPEDLLVAVKALERELGRTTTFRWGPRVVDVDILTFGEVRLATPALTLPHPHLLERQFVLVPLAEMAPELEVAPGVTAGKLAQADAPGVRRVGRLAEVVGRE